MKKQTKGLFFVILFGGGLLFWATAASVPGITPGNPNATVTITGTPADNFPDVERSMFCQTGDAKSNSYVTEYKIPAECTQPLAITTDPRGDVWFAQTNTGTVTKFDPDTEAFVSYENPLWPDMGHSMMWGMDYSPDDSIWFTDDTYDSVWKFSIPEEEYQRISYPSSGNSLPQKLKVEGSQIVVNDFVGSKLTFLDPARVGDDIVYLNVPSPANGSFTSDFTVDDADNIWYTNWVFGQGGILIKFDQAEYTVISSRTENFLPLFDFVEVFELPTDVSVPNGIVIGPEGRVWLLDTASSFFFSFDEATGEFTQYVTSDPPESSYGNATGVIQMPVSRPYWSEIDDYGRIVFNEQTANSIGVFDPIRQTLVEYLVPSKNPNWSDCEGIDDCGLAQIFGIAPDGDKVWFTQWVENNIGVIDTSVVLPYSVEADRVAALGAGQTAELMMTVTSLDATQEGAHFVVYNTATPDLTVSSSPVQLGAGPVQDVTITIAVSESAPAASHKVLLGVRTADVTVSQYVTVVISE